MDVAAGWRVAAGASQVVEYLLAPETIDVPRTPEHCAGLLIWRDRMIPVIDFAPLQTEPAATAPWMEGAERAGNERSTTVKAQRAVILAYQDAPAQPLRYGALLVTAAPAEFWVSDDMAGALAEMPAVFRHIARSCFVQHGQVIPILDAHQLFTRPLQQLPVSADEVDERVIHLDESTFAERMQPAAGELPQGFSVVEDIQVWTSPWMDEADCVENKESRPSLIEASLPVTPPELARHDPQADGMAAGEFMDEQGTSPWMDEADRVGNERFRPHRERAVDEAVAAAYCVVLPFPSSRSADAAPAAPEPMRLVEVGDLPEFVLAETSVPAEIEFLAALDDEVMDGGGTSPGMDEVARAGSERSRPCPETEIERPVAPMDGGEDATSAGIAAAAAQQEHSNTLQSFQRLRAIEQAIEGREPHPQHRRWQLLAAAVGLAILIGALFMLMDFSGRAPAPAPESVARDVAPGGINPASVPSTPAQPPK
jgi:chemotaxis signal transduction protein